MRKYYLIPVNPEPWAIGTVAAGRKNGKTFGRISPNPNLVAYQNAVKEIFEGVEFPSYDAYSLTFWFWRNTARYIDAADRRRSRNEADATNMQKGLEDALQGVMFDNDRRVKEIRSVVMAQGPDVEGRTLVCVEQIDDGFFDQEFNELPTHAQELACESVVPQLSSNQWKGPAR